MIEYFKSAQPGDRLMFTVNNDSMSPAVLKGDHVLARVIDRDELRKFVGKTVIVVLKDGRTTFRRLKSVSPRRGWIGSKLFTLAADNEDVGTCSFRGGELMYAAVGEKVHRVIGIDWEPSAQATAEAA